MLRWRVPRCECGVLCLSLLLILGFGRTAGAQSVGTGTLVGRVADENGGSISGAKVTVRNVDTNATRELETTSDGDYRAVLLQPGSYEVIVQKQGFATLKREEIRVEVGSTVNLDLVLKVASISQEITVAGATPLIEPEKMESSQVVDETVTAAFPAFITTIRWMVQITTRRFSLRPAGARASPTPTACRRSRNSK